MERLDLVFDFSIARGHVLAILYGGLLCHRTIRFSGSDARDECQIARRRDVQYPVHRYTDSRAIDPINVVPT